MLELVILFLLSLMGSAITIWLYRKIFGCEGLGDSLVVRTPQWGAERKMDLQQAFASLVSAPKERARYKRLRSPQGGVKTPWGW